jgi:hypothetical protein
MSKGSDAIDSIRRLAKSKFSGLIQLISGADGGRQRLRLSSIEHHGPDARGRHRGARFRRRNGEPPACFGQAGYTSQYGSRAHRPARRATMTSRLLLIPHHLIGAAAFAPMLLAISVSLAPAERLDGINVIEVPDHPFGSASAELALARAKQVGAGAVAIVPFLWQSSPSSPDIVRGADMPDEAVRAAVRQAHKAGFTVIVKPHVWVPQSWAGAVALATEDDWHAWFAGYRRAIAQVGRIAAEEHVDALAIGTELAKTTHRPEWFEIVAAARAAFAGTLTYFAHNTEEAERIPFWAQLDAIGVTLYPPLGADQDRAGRLAAMRDVADRLDALSAASGKPVLVGEIGLRSAVGAAAKPWESAEERESPPDPLLQAEVLGDWLAVLDRPTIRGVLIWRWLTDPDAGGPADTDFTVQGKPAEAILQCAWKVHCGRR